MLGRVGIPVVVSLAVMAGLAIADGSPRHHATAHASALRLPTPSGCVHRSVRVTVVPPDQHVFTSLSVLVGDDEILQLASLAGPGSLKVTLPEGRSRIRVSATTDDGRFLRSGRTYRRCSPKPSHPAPATSPAPTPTPLTGGGDQ